jgi:hypothetical protein
MSVTEILAAARAEKAGKQTQPQAKERAAVDRTAAEARPRPSPQPSPPTEAAAAPEPAAAEPAAQESSGPPAATAVRDAPATSPSMAGGETVDPKTMSTAQIIAWCREHDAK